MQVPTLEEHQALMRVVSELRQRLAELEEKLNKTTVYDRHWYTMQEVMELYKLKDTRTILRYQKLGLLNRKEIGRRKLYSREEVLNLPMAVKEYKRTQV